jgi:hypothetical protein
MERAGWVGVEGIVGCYVTSWQIKLVDLVFNVSCYKVVNMAVKVENCIKEEQWFVMHFLWAEGVPGWQIHQRTSAQYGTMLSLVDLCMSGSKCLKRLNAFDWYRVLRPSNHSHSHTEWRKT